MTSSLRHDEIEELLGAYALDAVGADEAETVELHLRECARCRAEVEEHREMAALLAHSGSSAPAEVWERITDSIGEASSPPTPLRLPPHARPRSTRWLSGALAVAAGVIAVLGFQVTRLDSRVDDFSAAISRDGLDRGLQAALLDPSAIRVRLSSSGGEHGADAVVLPDGRGYLAMASAAELDDGRTYQLWGINGENVVSLGVLGPDPSVVGFSAAGRLSSLAITVERAGGAAQPSGEPILSGAVSRSA